MQKKLTGWLIVLIVILGPLSFTQTSRYLAETPKFYKTHFPDSPSLPNAIMLFQFLVGLGTVVLAYTAWVLYRRKPGTLKTAQTSFVVGACVRLAGGYSIPLFGGLPPRIAEKLIQQSLIPTIVALVMVGLWYLYLTRSERVRDIYSE